MPKVIEIFRTIHGDGKWIGTPSIFVRFAGCDFRCKWCDTKYAQKGGVERSPVAIAEIIRSMAGGKPYMVTFTGGNPCMQNLGGLLRQLELGFKILVETQGSKAPAWLDDVDCLSVSPKPPSSGNVVTPKQVEKCLRYFMPDNSCIKVIVSDRKDFEYAVDMQKYLGREVIVEPCNHRKTVSMDWQKYLKDLRQLAEWIMQMDNPKLRLLPQLHLMLFGNKRGT